MVKYTTTTLEELHEQAVTISDDKFIKELTVGQLKNIIREIISEEIAKRTFTEPYPYPVQPFYHEPCYPYQHQQVWATDHTVMKDFSTDSKSSGELNNYGVNFTQDISNINYKGEIDG